MKNTATPQVTTTPDFRAELSLLVDACTTTGESLDVYWAAVGRAHAALAEPEGEGPTDAELLAQAAESLGYERIPLDHEGGAAEAYACELLAFARAVLARWGQR